MLLRRVIEHVKAQNWTAVAIDFVIVVVGVFIGIQVSNWNDARQEAASRQLVHQRLLQDFALIEQQTDQAVARMERVLSSLISLQKAVTRGSAEVGDAEQIKYALEWGYSYPSFNQRSGTYIELLSSGRLDLIEDEKIRIELSKYDQRVRQSRFNETQINEFFSDNVSLVVFGRYHTFALPPRNDDSEFVRGQITSFDIDAMSADSDYRVNLDRMIENRTWLMANVYGQRRSVRRVMSALQESI